MPTTKAFLQTCLFGFAATALLSACDNGSAGDDDSETGNTTDATSTTGDVDPTLDGECSLEDRVGLFRVYHEEGYSAADGEINDGVVPTSVLHETLAEGDCRLMKRENPFCDPPCGPGEVCTHEGTCVPYPERQETGDVTIDGLDVPLTMEPRSDKRYFDTTLPHPAFSPGTTISLTSTGSEVGPLSLSGRGISPIVVSDTSWTIAEATDLSITWEAEEGDASFYLTINIDQHGNSPSTLVCETEDDGELVVPASVIDALLESGTSGFPMGHAYRRTADSQQAGEGCVEFQVFSHIGVDVEVAGHTPCTSDADCPDGQTCDLMLQTCV